MKISVYASGIVLALAAAAAFAQDGGPCRADVQKYCAQSQGDREKAMDCLLDHQQDITDACYEALKKRLNNQGQAQGQGQGQGQGQQGQGPLQACRQDVQKLCAGVQPGGGRIVNCLLDHQKDLSDACYDVLSKKTKGGGK
jgi:hypothetical protein